MTSRKISHFFTATPTLRSTDLSKNWAEVVANSDKRNQERLLQIRTTAMARQTQQEQEWKELQEAIQEQQWKIEKLQSEEKAEEEIEEEEIRLNQLISELDDWKQREIDAVEREMAAEANVKKPSGEAPTITELSRAHKKNA